MLRVTPIYGSKGQSHSSISVPPSCTLIEYGGVKILVNVGFDESLSLINNATMDNKDISAGKGGVPSVLPSVDAVLLTDSSLHSLAGIPILYGKNSSLQKKSNSSSKANANAKNNASNAPKYSQPPIYATFPTVKMGQMNLYDHHANVSFDGGNPGYALSDVDALFSPFVYQQSDPNNVNSNASQSDGQLNSNNGDSLDADQKAQNQSLAQTQLKPIQTIKYAQTIIVNDPITNKPAIAITPQRAGHLVGASFFILKRLTDETEVVVAPIYHHAKEKHLDNSTLYKYATACDVLVTTCGGPGSILGSLYIPHKNNKPILNPPSVARDEGELIETILSTLRRGGNVLLPTDTSGRVLELLYLLNQHWERHRLGSAYNLCWVGSMVHNTLEFARSQLEWMAAPLGAQFDSGRGHPYALSSVQRYSTVAELEANCFSDEAGEGNSNPTCVLASGASLDHGPARDLFLKWSDNADNAIVITDSRRCVQRGVVVQQKEQYKQLQLQQQNIDGVAAVGPGLRTVNIVGGTSSEDVSGMGVRVAAGSGGDTPIIIQDEEESSGALNIGTAVTMDRVSEYSTAGQLLLKWCEAKAEKEEMADVVECDAMVPKRAPLAGAELKAFLKQEESKRLKEKAAEERRAMMREVELAKGRLRLNEEESGTSGVKAPGSSGVGTQSTDAQGQDSSRPKKKSRFDANLFLKYSKPCHSKFDYVVPIIRFDEVSVIHHLN